MKVTAIITTDPEGIHVRAVWDAPVDRTTGHGWLLPAHHKALAARLAKAIEAGAVFESPTIRTDVYGQTYVAASSRVLGRHMNADLTKLGF